MESNQSGRSTSSQPGATTPNDIKISGGCDKDSTGMCVPDAHAMNVSLNLNDTPVGYAPQKGPSAFIRLTYNQRDAYQPANSSFFNVGAKWTLNVLSYVTDYLGTQYDSGAQPPAPVSRYVGGGGLVQYTSYYSTNSSFAPEAQTGAVLSRTPCCNFLLSYARSYTLTNPDGSQLVYGQPDGAIYGYRRMFLSAIVDPQGNSVALAYDSRLRLTTMTDAAGRVTTFSYGLTATPFLVTAITDPFGRRASFGYDSSGRLTSITDVLGIVSSFGYDANGWVNTLTTPYGTSTFSYSDPKATDPNRFLELTDAMGFTERLEFRHEAPGTYGTEPAPGGMSTNVDYLHDRNSFYWDKHVYPMYGASTVRDYTKARRWHWLHTSPNSNQTSPILESIKAPLESRVWYNYPSQSDPRFEGSPGFNTAGGAVTAAGRVLDDGTTQLFKATYNPTGRPLTVTDPLGRVTKFTYAVNNIDLLTKQQQTSTTPTYATLASYTSYNSQHEPLTMTDAAGQLWKYGYNSAGQVATVTDPKNKVTTFNYDSSGRLSTVVNANNATALTLTYCVPTSNNINCDLPQTVIDSEGRVVAYQRDNLDRVTVATYPDGTTDRYTYTNLDRTGYTDRLGRTTSYGYDPNRRLKSVRDPLGQIVGYSYYRNGVLNTLTDQNGNVTTWAIDIQGRPTRKTFANGTAIVYGYETSTSRLKTTTDALLQVKTLGYYLDDTVRYMTYTGTVNPTPNVSFTYDPIYPRRTGMVDGIGSTSWSYVPVGIKGALAVQTEDGPLTNDAVTYGYDELGRVSSLTVGDNQTETWAYDAIGRATSHGTTFGTFAYGFLGQTADPISRTLTGSSISTTWNYDTNANDRRLIGITNSSGARSFTFGYQRFGAHAGKDPYQIASISQSAGALPAQLSCYQYDDAGRLLNVSAPPTASGNCSQALTPLYSFAVDGVGNQATFTGASGATSRTYNNLNQIATSPGQTFTFNPAGNETGDGTRIFKWDAEDRVVEIDSGSNVTTFRYDGLGRRLEEKSSGFAQQFTWCGSRLCALRWDSPVVRYFSEGQFHILSGATYVIAPDQLGNARDDISMSGATVASSSDYTPYGEVKSGRPFNSLAFGGLYLNSNLGLYYSSTRFYDPALGRWLSRDPIAEAGGINLYAYVGGDPVNRIDPSGLILVQVAGGLVGGIAGAVGAYISTCGDLRAAGIGFGVGAVTGVLSTIPGGLAASAAWGGLAGAFGNVGNALGSNKRIDPTSLAISTVAGAAGGVIGGAVTRGLTGDVAGQWFSGSTPSALAARATGAEVSGAILGGSAAGSADMVGNAALSASAGKSCNGGCR
jgi:RHS repeat-associated protein